MSAAEADAWTEETDQILHLEEYSQKPKTNHVNICSVRLKADCVRQQAAIAIT